MEERDDRSTGPPAADASSTIIADTMMITTEKDLKNAREDFHNMFRLANVRQSPGTSCNITFARIVDDEGKMDALIQDMEFTLLAAGAQEKRTQMPT